ncbi:unnamed protein product [Symbiodinium sp. CCMP2592]|nr:unnamed protein product [Symbiodinium sp. CCMP2592]
MDDGGWWSVARPASSPEASQLAGLFAARPSTRHFMKEEYRESYPFRTSADARYELRRQNIPTTDFMRMFEAPLKDSRLYDLRVHHGATVRARTAKAAEATALERQAESMRRGRRVRELTSAEQMRQLCDVMRTMHRGGRTESKDGKQKRLVVSQAWSSMGNLNYQEAKNGQHQEESQNRTYEVIAKTGTVKAEPHMDAKLKTKKSKGSRFIVSEMTMNGWLKLENEPGWLAAHLRGVQDIGEVAAPLETDPMLELAVPVYQPQGMVCLEVVFKTGVPVRETPSRKAKTVATLKCGEYVFAHTQNFDGWLKLSGKPEGWVLANDSDWGELLRRRRRMNDIDLWAMCDAWAAARARPGTGRSMGLSGKEVEALKELEERTVMEAKALWQEHRSNKEYLVSEGYLAGEDLLKTETWMRQRVFAHVLEKKSKSGEGWLRELISGFKLSSRVPPLPGIQGEQEEDDYYAEQQAQAQSFSQGLRKGFTNANGGAMGGAMGGPMGGAMGGQQGHGAFDPAFEGTKPFEYKGKIYTMAPNGVLFDPPNQVPMGIWNPDTQRLDPAAGMMPGCPYPAISYLGRTYILLPDQRLLDPETEEIVGTFNRDTNEMDLQNPTLLQEVCLHV